MARRLVLALVLLAAACAGDPAADAVFACDPSWATTGAPDPCLPGCRCEAAPAGRPYLGVCACGAAAFDFGPSGTDAADGGEVVEDVPDDGIDADDLPDDAPADGDAADAEGPVCVPECAGMECGPDGCDGSCGDCGPGFVCTEGYCKPDCWENDCPAGFVMGGACRCRVPSTGSHLCNNGSGLVACSLITGGQDFFGQDAHFDGSPRVYEDEGDGTVRDQDTGLVWAGTLVGEGIWSDAMQRCSDNIAGLPGSSWHLPSAYELLALIDHGTECPTWDALFGAMCGAGPVLWSSTVRPNDVALVGDFERGTLSASALGATMDFRCVRGGGKNGLPIGADRFGARKTGVVDRLTGLEWQIAPAAASGDWKTALATCLNLGSGWRLPTVNELASIAIFSATGCVGWPAVFGSDCGSPRVYWSSTPQAWAPEAVYCMDFGSYAVIGVSLLETSPATRCVRSADAIAFRTEAGR
jgi:hypothetical protein